jgi:hydrogenase nickel incorporation protein HypA/HybF
MHELSIAIRLVDIAADHCRAAGGAGVAAVTVAVGPLAGVAREHTPLAAADLRIRHVPVRVWCPACAAERDLAALVPLACPACGTPTGEIRGGAELDLESLDLVVAESPQPVGTAAP